MPLPIASHKDLLYYKGACLSLKGLSSININFDRRTITYEINIDTVLQGVFIEDEIRKGAISYDKALINKPCTLQIKGHGDLTAVFLSYMYNSRKNKYQCTIVQSFSNEEIMNTEGMIDMTVIEDNKFNTLDFS